MKNHRVLILTLLFAFYGAFSQAQQIDSYKFTSFKALPTWCGVAVDWNTKPKAYLYDPRITRGHAEFVNKKLGRAITFKQFKDLASKGASRQYLPFFIYDLSTKPLSISGKKYTFALRIEDYSYDDTPEKMAKEVAKLLKLLPSIDARFAKEGLVVITQRDNDPLNINLVGKYLNALKLEKVSTNELIKQMGGAKFEVLNEAIAVGKLRLVQSEEEMVTLTSEDIAIFEFTPKRIPPLAGIITLEAQTPLSHINLLAKNRNTLNMYVTDLASVPELSTNVDKLVEINTAFQKFIVKPISQEKAEAFWLKNKPAPLSIPVAKANFESVIPLTNEFKAYHSVEMIGAKAANYALIYHLLGDNLVHPAFAIGFKPYLDLVEQGAAKEINFFLSKKKELSASERKQALAHIRQVILKSKPSEAMLTSLRSILERHFPNGRVKLRSSTNCEDLPQFNGAGLYESKGFSTKDSDEVLAKKITEVYASLWNDIAFEEREYFGIDHKKAAMAILVSPAFVDEYANGVILATPLVKDKGLQVLVNAQLGENEVTNPEKGAVPESFYVSKKGFDKVVSQSNLGKIFVGNTALQKLALPMREATEKIHTALIERLDKNLKDAYSTDIEFKIVKDKKGAYHLFFKQARLLKTTILPE